MSVDPGLLSPAQSGVKGPRFPAPLAAGFAGFSDDAVRWVAGPKSEGVPQTVE